MYGLWNELFGFPVNDCDYEAIKCDKRYIPVLNWDRDNEFVWGLMEPFGGLDAHDISFNTISPDRDPAQNNVADALNSLQSQIKAITNHTELISFTLAVDSESTVTGKIVYIDKQGNQQEFVDSFNIKDIVESLDLKLSNLEVDNLKVNETFVSDGTSEFNGVSTFNEDVDMKKDLNVEGTTSTNGIENTGDISTDNMTVNTKLEVLGDTVTNGIENTGDIVTDSIHADNGEIKTLVSDDATINTKLEVLGDTVTNGIQNTGTIDTDEIQATTGTITDLTAENAKVTTKLEVTGDTVTNGITNTGLIETTDELVHNNLVVDGNTDLQTLEVNGKADFREDVKVYDDFYVSGNTTLNGELKVNGPETHNGDTVFNGDVKINGELIADNLDIDLSGYQKTEEKGVASGYASLDNTGKVPMSQLPNISGGVVYKGGWDASTGSYPSNPSNGDMYYCTTAGTVSGQTYNVGDRIIYDADNNRWDALPDNYGVQSVNGRSGIVVDVQDTTDRKDTVDLTTPATTKYLSEKAVADLINPLIQRIEDLEEEAAKTTVVSLDSTSGLPATMNEGQTYTVPFQNLTTADHIVILDTVTNGNIVITPGNGQISIVSSANESNPVVNVLVIKGA